MDNPGNTESESPELKRQFKRLRYIAYHGAVSQSVQTILDIECNFKHDGSGYHARSGGSLLCRRRQSALSSFAAMAGSTNIAGPAGFETAGLHQGCIAVSNIFSDRRGRGVAFKWSTRWTSVGAPNC